LDIASCINYCTVDAEYIEATSIDPVTADAGHRIINEQYFLSRASKIEGASFFRGLAASNLSAVFLPLDSGHQRSCCLIDYPPTRGLKEPSARKHEKHESKANET
ncbi:hypothetical protein ALC60_10113, partial [Trachymyrmex zeteki]